MSYLIGKGKDMKQITQDRILFNILNNGDNMRDGL